MNECVIAIDDCMCVNFLHAADVKAVARAVPSLPQPCIVAQVSDGNIKDAFLVIERSPLLLGKFLTPKATYWFCFPFNVHYPDGCCNFFTLLEVATVLKQKSSSKAFSLSVIAKSFTLT